jgi:hypothetical protein
MGLSDFLILLKGTNRELTAEFGKNIEQKMRKFHCQYFHGLPTNRGKSGWN